MEPERQIEKLLRAVAKKRRDQAGDPVQLHPVARQELLREVSRQSRQTTSGGLFSNLFGSLRPRLALAACFLAILGIAGWLAVPLLSGKRNASSIGAAHSDLAFAKKGTPVTTPAPATPAPATPQANPSSGLPVLQPFVPNELAANRKSAPVNTESSGQANVPVSSMNSDKLSDVSTTGSAQPAISSSSAPRTAGQLALKNPTPPTPTATVAAAPPVTVAAAEPQAQKSLNAQNATASMQADSVTEFDADMNKDRAATRTAPASQRFYRVAVAPATRRQGQFGGAAGGGVSGAAPVLASFQVEQLGPQIRIVDADGSVYTGHWQTTPFEKTPAPAAFAAPGAASLHNGVATVQAPKRETPAPPIHYYFFRVSGTNRNLKQNVVFSGSFIPLTNVLRESISGTAETRRAAPATATPPMLSNSRIAGKVAIGNKREIELNATPAP